MIFKIFFKKIRNKRPTWDEYFFEVMNAVSERATCDRGKSGCVIVRDNQILCTGYVGAPPHFPDCYEAGHKLIKVKNDDGTESEHCVRTIHAEENAILQAARMGIALEGATLYCKMTPCERCARMIMRVGIKKVKCLKKYHRGQWTEKAFKKAKIKLKILNKIIEKY